LVVLTLWSVCPVGAACADHPDGRLHIAVVKSLDLPEYNAAYEGFLAEVTAQGHKVKATPFILDRDPQKLEATCQAISDSKPDLIFALGTRAAREVAKRETTIPIVYAMVLAMPDDSRGGPFLRAQSNLTGATLNIPMETQLDEIQRVFPTAKRIGVLSDPSKTKSIVAAARFMVESRGLSMHVAWASSEAEVPDAVRQIRDSIDVLWMLPDETILTPRSARFIIFELIKAGIPVVGLSGAYVKAGALMALECNYNDIGHQSGEIAARILSGTAPQQVPQTVPRAFTRTLNLKVREHMKTPIDESVIEDSNVVIY
jgi:putative ABC transport system substrate-binding protein